MNVNADVNFEELGRSTEDFNGAQLKAVCVEAGILALRRDSTEVCHEDFNEGIIQVQARKKASLKRFAEKRAAPCTRRTWRRRWVSSAMACCCIASMRDKRPCWVWSSSTGAVFSRTFSNMSRNSLRMPSKAMRTASSSVAFESGICIE